MRQGPIGAPLAAGQRDPLSRPSSRRCGRRWLDRRGSDCLGLEGDADVAAAAALIGEPARASVLMALADDRSLAASTLAAEAGVAPSTASNASSPAS